MERNDRMPKKKCKTRSNKQANERVSGRNGRTDKGGSGLGQGRQVRTGQCQVRSESGKKRYQVGNDGCGRSFEVHKGTCTCIPSQVTATVTTTVTGREWIQGQS